MRISFSSINFSGQSVIHTDGDDTLLCWHSGKVNQQLDTVITHKNVEALNQITTPVSVITGRGASLFQDVIPLLADMKHLTAIGLNSGLDLYVKPPSQSVAQWLRRLSQSQSIEWQSRVREGLGGQTLPQLVECIEQWILQNGYVKAKPPEGMPVFSPCSRFYVKNSGIMEFFPGGLGVGLTFLPHHNLSAKNRFLSEANALSVLWEDHFKGIPQARPRVQWYGDQYAHFLFEHKRLHKRACADYVNGLLGVDQAMSFGDSGNDFPLLSQQAMGRVPNAAAVVGNAVFHQQVVQKNSLVRFFDTLAEGINHFKHQGYLQ